MAPQVKMPKLSSSKIETLESCTWKYYCRYVLKMPGKANAGQLRGNCIHTILECLARKDDKRKEYLKKILSAQSVDVIPGISRYVKSFISYYPEFLTHENDTDLIKVMMLVGLQYDFSGTGLKKSESLEPEMRFDIVSESPAYSITGFMDRVFLYEDGEKKVLIRDYKSGKSKKNADELRDSTQGFMYSLAARKKFPEHKPEVEFLFLKFVRKPSQRFSVSESALKGFEYYLADLTEFIADFTIEKARAKFAANNFIKKRMMCGSDQPGKYICEFRKPFDYYAVVEDNVVIRSAYTKAELEPKLAPNQKIEIRRYTGCPAFSRTRFVHPDFK